MPKSLSRDLKPNSWSSRKGSKRWYLCRGLERPGVGGGPILITSLLRMLVPIKLLIYSIW